MENPFKFGSLVDAPYFTDRVKELDYIVQFLKSENHLVLMSPRRFGKSSLRKKGCYSNPATIPMAQYTSPMTDKVSVSFQPSTDKGTTAIEDVLDRQVCNGQYLRRQQSYIRQEPTYQHDDQCLIAFKQERLYHPKWQIWNRRPILQEMDTQEYDWVRLYIEKSPTKSFYSFTGDFAREIYLCVNKTNSLQIGLWLDIN